MNILKSYLARHLNLIMNPASDDNFQPAKRFRVSKSKDEEVSDAVPRSTRYKNKWAISLYEVWRESRTSTWKLNNNHFKVRLAILDGVSKYCTWYKRRTLVG